MRAVHNTGIYDLWAVAIKVVLIRAFYYGWFSSFEAMSRFKRADRLCQNGGTHTHRDRVSKRSHILLL